MRDQIVRLCVLLRSLRASRRGQTVAALVEETGASRATVYRDFAVLRAAGLDIDRDTVNGEVRHRLAEEALATRALGAGQVAAIALAREALTALEGTEVIAELDGILSDRHIAKGRVRARDLIGPRSPAIVRAIDRAIRDTRRLRISYRGMNDESWRWREVDPGALQLQRGELYLWAWAIDRRAWRTFKIARVRQLETLATPAGVHPGLAEVLALPHSVRVWSGPPAQVAIRIAPEVAWLAKEYPLVPDQHVEEQSDGAIVVRAAVAGLVEAGRWALRWGQNARVLEPPELRDSVRDELRQALAGYEADDRVVSPIVRQPSGRTATGVKAAKRRQAP